MKIGYSFILIALLSLALSPFLPWWIIAPISFFTCFFAKLTWGKSFLISFLAVYLVWLDSIFFADYGTIRNIVGDLFSMPAHFTPYLSATLGALVAGLFGMAGSLIKKDQPQ